MIPKFRAWNKKTESFIDSGDLMLDLKNAKVYAGDVGIPEYTIDVTKQVVLMQSTGLHDKNGVEIYEGDILGRQFYVNAIVSYDDGAFVQGWNCYRKHRLDQDFCSSREVIGNVYENKELLND